MRDKTTGFACSQAARTVEALNYDRLANVDDNTCRYDVCPDFNGDGEVQNQRPHGLPPALGELIFESNQEESRLLSWGRLFLLGQIGVYWT